MKRKFWNWIRDESVPEESRTLFLSGEISDETWWGDETTPQMFREELESGSGDIAVWINSPGGDVFAAAQIYNMLRDYKGKVTVKIDGLAASAASVIAMAGDKVTISPVGMLMIHDPMMMAVGNTRDMEQAIHVLNEVKESIINAYAAKSGLSHKKISELMANETWMNAKKAKELGFVDEILFEDSATESAQKTESTKEENPPKDTTPEKPKSVYPVTDVLFSRKAVEDSFIEKVNETVPKNQGVRITDLDKRLSLLSH